MHDPVPPAASEETNPLRGLPSVDRVLVDPRVATLILERGAGAVTALVREVLREQRTALASGAATPPLPAVDVVLARAETLRPSLRRVVNATGVIIHTNLGRAPLSHAAAAAMHAAVEGYSTLEYDLAEGERGTRMTHLDRLLCLVSGAEAGMAVNNNAAALVLGLAALCAGREVIISRGQLVEIGGGFRIPDVLRQSGATLVEVGTTNRTYPRDYAEAITDRTAAILRVHSSNFRLVGFTTEPTLGELARVAHEHGLLLLDDLGSGALLDTRQFGLAEEPMVQQSILAGADVVFASGDKLLGGPQAGIAFGRTEPLAAMRRHPLARAFRLDKGTIAALAATLDHYARGEALTEVPVWRMIAADPVMLADRAARWVSACGPRATAAPDASTVGGGSLPGETLPTTVCAVAPSGTPHPTADGFAAALRTAEPPIIARIQDGRVLLDPRTVEAHEDEYVAATLARLCGEPAPEEASAGR